VAYSARAQAKVYAIGILETVPRAQNQANFAALLNGLRELGYVEGQNLRIDYRSADGQGERFPELVAELVRNRVDLIVTRGTPAARAAKAATTTVPIVMAAIGEPLGVGVVASLARPGGNVTGLSAFVTELSGKRIELLKETFPSVSTVGFLNNLGNPVAPPPWGGDQSRRVDASARGRTVRRAQRSRHRAGLLDNGRQALGRVVGRHRFLDPGARGADRRAGGPTAHTDRLPDA
jgi:putative ABC transport system substrate-binding protein